MLVYPPGKTLLGEPYHSPVTEDTHLEVDGDEEAIISRCLAHISGGLKWSVSATISEIHDLLGVWRRGDIFLPCDCHVSGCKHSPRHISSCLTPAEWSLMDDLISKYDSICEDESIDYGDVRTALFAVLSRLCSRI